MSQTYAEKLREIRTDAGWSRPKMVERVGVPLRTIEDWEAGKMTPPEYVQKLVLDRLMLEIEKAEHEERKAKAEQAADLLHKRELEATRKKLGL